jgi:hypothetical protein
MEVGIDNAREAMSMAAAIDKKGRRVTVVV